MKGTDTKKIVIAGILLVLLVLTFFMLKPLLMAILAGLILAFIFNPIYNFILKFIKIKSFAAGIICFFLIIILVLPLWFFTPLLIEQSFKFYQYTQEIDLLTPLQSIFPTFFSSELFAGEISSVVHAFITKSTNSLVSSFSNLFLNLPKLLLQFFIVFFTLFFALRDKKEFFEYIKDFSPFSKEVEKKFFESSKRITSAVLYGQIVVGLIQGVILAIGLFIFKVPNALLLSILASIAGVFPIIGTPVIWIPVIIYMLISGNQVGAIGILIFGLISSNIDNILRPLIVSRKTKISTALILLGMIGGIFIFGILGFILGPLIIAYLIIILETYKDKKSPEIFIQEEA